MVERLVANQSAGVRFSSPAHNTKTGFEGRFLYCVRVKQSMGMLCVENRKPEYTFFSRKKFEAGSQAFFCDDRKMTCDRFSFYNQSPLRKSYCPLFLHQILIFEVLSHILGATCG
jgi:hypothetical protein